MKKKLLQLWWRLVRFGFRLLYNEMAWTYDVVSWLVSLGQWRAWQRAALPFLHGNSILEIAHGPGHMLLELAAAGREVAGYDLSPAMGRLAQRRVGRAGLEVDLIRGEAQALPFVTAAFDSVLSTFPTDFILSAETLHSIYRVLKPGGRLVIVPAARFTGTGWLYRFIEWLYVVTGQRPELTAAPQQRTAHADHEAHLKSLLWQRFAHHFIEAGFHLQMEQIQLKTSTVTVVIAEKR